MVTCEYDGMSLLDGEDCPVCALDIEQHNNSCVACRSIYDELVRREESGEKLWDLTKGAEL